MLYTVAFGNGSFVAIGDGVLTSTNGGVNWQARTLGTNVDLRAFAFGNDRFVAIDTTPGQAWMPRTGLNWTMGIHAISGCFRKDCAARPPAPRAVGS